MADRNTHITKRQIGDQAVDVPDLETTNSASDKQVPSYDSASGKFKWVDALIALWTGYTEKTTPTANDIFLINDSDASNVLKKTLWSDIKTTLKIYFDGLYKATFAYTAEDVANKSTNVTTDGASDTKYPSVKAVKTYVDNSVIGLLDYRGGYNASGNTYPTTGGSGTEGAILKGDLWIISVAGTLGGVAVQVGDAIVALVDTPGQTSTNWNSLNGNIAYVPEDVANKSTDGTLADNSTIKYPSQSAVKTYADGKLSKSTAGEINALTNKSTPVDADVIVGEDSANSWSKIKIILSNLKSYLKTYFDTLYIAITAPANGDMIYYNNGAWQRLPIGTAGQTLKINLDAFTKAMLHMDGSDAGTSFTDEIGKAITNTEHYDNYNKLMVHNDGTQGATAFTDSATSKAITNIANYDSQTKLMLHGSASPFVDAIGKTVTNNNVTLDSVNTILGKPSMAFNGTTAYLSLADSADWYMGTGQFNIEGEIIFGNTSGTLCSQFADGNNYANFVYDSNLLRFIVFSGSVDQVYFTCPFTISLGTTYHIVLQRNSTTNTSADWSIFINGISQTLTLVGGAWSGAYSDIGAALTIGEYGGANFFKGNMGEFRISKGVARYPVTGFTPPTAPFGQVYVDTSVKKFGTGSARFLGGGEYLSLGNSADFNFGTGDFTIDGWINPSIANTASNGLFGIGTAYYSIGGFFCYCPYAPSNLDIVIYIGKDGAGGAEGWDTGKSLTAGAWNHVAMVRSLGVLKFYVNGVGSSPHTYTGQVGNSSDTFVVGNSGYTVQTSYFQGNIDEFRVSKGIARWTSNFTPPAYPYGKVLTSTSAKEFGTASGWFDGEGSYLSTLQSSDFALGSADFTIDAWVNFQTNLGFQSIFGSWGQTSDSYQSHCAYVFGWKSDSSGRLFFMFSTNGKSGTAVTQIGGAWIPTLNTWYHVAVVLYNHTIKFYVNGVQSGSSADMTGITIFAPDQNEYIGTHNPTDTQPEPTDANSNFFNGYIDELRVSPGIARWTTAFTPPPAPYSILPIWST